MVEFLLIMLLIFVALSILIAIGNYEASRERDLYKSVADSQSRNMLKQKETIDMLERDLLKAKSVAEASTEERDQWRSQRHAMQQKILSTEGKLVEAKEDLNKAHTENVNLFREINSPIRSKEIQRGVQVCLELTAKLKNVQESHDNFVAENAKLKKQNQFLEDRIKHLVAGGNKYQIMIDKIDRIINPEIEEYTED